MRRYRVNRAALVCVAVACLVGTPFGGVPAARGVSDLDLALHWAPVHHQDTDDSDADADYMTAVDFDGDWVTTNNWEHQDDDPRRLRAVGYHSVVETATHWFIVYAFYHPRDWCDRIACEATGQHHENDLEGLLLAVRKTGGFGRLDAMVTVFHKDFLRYVPERSGVTAAPLTLRGAVRTVAYEGNAVRPRTMQEAKGHGLEGWDGKEFPGGDGILYFPHRTTSGLPAHGNDRSAFYRLVDIFAPGGMWDRRDNRETFSSPGVFAGDNGRGAAHAPWGWDDHDDGDEFRGGELARDPARLVDAYFDNLGEFGRSYVRNRYAR